jgi:chaperonin GroEL
VSEVTHSAQMLRQAAEKTGDAVGDGTSTSTILAHAILLDGVRNVAAGASAIDIKRGLDQALVVVVEELKKLSKPVMTPSIAVSSGAPDRNTTSRFSK